MTKFINKNTPDVKGNPLLGTPRVQRTRNCRILAPKGSKIHSRHLANVVNSWVTVRHNANDLQMENRGGVVGDTHRGEVLTYAIRYRLLSSGGSQSAVFLHLRSCGSDKLAQDMVGLSANRQSSSGQKRRDRCNARSLGIFPVSVHFILESPSTMISSPMPCF
jgi:hypothetical protein